MLNNDQVIEENKLGRIEISKPKASGNRFIKEDSDFVEDGSLTNLADAMFDYIKSNFYRENKDLTRDMFKSYIITLMDMNRHHGTGKFNSTRMEEWSVPNLFADLVYPEKVTWKGLSEMPNLIETEKVKFVSDDDLERLSSLNHDEFVYVRTQLLKTAGQKKFEESPMVTFRAVKGFDSIMDEIVEDNRVPFRLDEDKRHYFMKVDMHVWGNALLYSTVYEYILFKFKRNWNNLVTLSFKHKD